jgi:anti-sigma factor RsiW
MKCEEVGRELIPYLDRRSNSADRAEIEKHLLACESCRTRAGEFRQLMGMLGEVPVHEPSFAFDARLRERIAAEPKRSWFGGLVPQPRLAFALALLLALTIVTARTSRQVAPPTASLTPEEQFQMIDHLGVLENYDLLTNSEVLAEVPVAPEQQGSDEQNQQQPDDSGGGS